VSTKPKVTRKEVIRRTPRKRNIEREEGRKQEEKGVRK
jgi:hypothetical protein